MMYKAEFVAMVETILLVGESASIPYAIHCVRYGMYHIASSRYCTAAVDKRVRSTSLYHCRQCSIVLKPRSDRIDYTVVCFVTHDCSRILRKQ